MSRKRSRPSTMLGGSMYQKITDSTGSESTIKDFRIARCCLIPSPPVFLWRQMLTSCRGKAEYW